MKFFSIYFILSYFLFSVSICFSSDILFQTSYDEKLQTTTYSMFENHVTNKIGSITSTKATAFAYFKSAEFLSADKSILPSEILEIATLMETINNADLETVAIIGSLYIDLNYRGQGNAKKIIDYVCDQLFEQGIREIRLIPHPFEYKDGIEKSLKDSPNFTVYKERLIELYKTCGFQRVEHKNFLYMCKK